MTFLSRLLGTSKAAEIPAVAATTVSAVEIPVNAPLFDGQPVPSYPAPGSAIPAAPVSVLVDAQRDLIAQLVQTLGFTPEERDRWLFPVVERYVAYAHLLPASETHHHCGIGGLFRHSLEVAFFAARYTEGIVFGLDLPAARRYLYMMQARLVTAMAGLLHDIGKPVVDVAVTDPATGAVWVPHVEDLASWLQARGIARYTIFWKPGQRHRRHEAFGASLVHTILGRDVIEYITRDDGRDLLDLLFIVINGAGDVQHPVAEAVRRGDSASVSQDLERQSTRATQAAGGSVNALATRILHAMQGAIRDGTWVPNTPGGPVWNTTRGLMLVFPDALEQTIARIRQEGRSSIPSDPKLLADSLRDGRYVRVRDTTMGAFATHQASIDVSAGAQRRLLDTTVMLVEQPEHVFGSMPMPAPVPAILKDAESGGSKGPSRSEPPSEVAAAAVAPQEMAPTTNDAPEATVDGDAIEDAPVITLRRNTEDVADRRIAERDRAKRDGFATAADAADWLDEIPYLGEAFRIMASNIARSNGVLAERDGQTLLLAHPGAFEGLGVQPQRIISLLREKQWLVPDRATPDRATISAKIGGKEVFAVRIQGPLAHALEMVADPGFSDEIPDDASATPAAPATTADRSESLELFTPPDDTTSAARTSEMWKRDFYGFLAARHGGDSFVFMDVAPIDMADALQAFAVDFCVSHEQLLAHLRAEPNRMLGYGAVPTPVRNFSLKARRGGG